MKEIVWRKKTLHVTSDANNNWVMAMAPQYLYQIEASHLDYMTPPLRVYPIQMEQWSGRGWEGYHLKNLSSKGSGQERTASFIYQALQEVEGPCFLFPPLLGFYNKWPDTITKEQKCLWFDWQLTWQLFIHLN